MEGQPLRWSRKGLCLLLSILDTSFCEHKAANTILYISLCCLAAAQTNPHPPQPLVSIPHPKFRVGQLEALL